MNRALVLGSGGLIGGAWEIGMLKGLLDAGIDLGDADLMVGSSVGATLAAGIRHGSISEVFDRWTALRPSSGSGPGRSDEESRYFGECCRLWGLAQQDVSARIELGRRAMATPNPISEEDQVAAARARFNAWPDKRLRIVAVDVENGSVSFIERSTGVPIEIALAASCSQPGLQSPIRVQGRRCMDGGVAGTNIDGAAGCRLVVAITAFPAGRKTLEEIETVRSSGGLVLHLAPDDESRRSMGSNLGDFERLEPSIEAGVRQGRVTASLEGLCLERSDPTGTFTMKIVIAPGEGVDLGGEFEVVVKVRAEDTNGVMAVIEETVPARRLISPHTHQNDVWVYVLSGEIGLLVGDEVRSASAGSWALKPRNIVHAMWNATKEPARIIEVLTPGGSERWFEELAGLQDGDKAGFDAAVRRHGIHFLADSPWTVELRRRFDLP